MAESMPQVGHRSCCARTANAPWPPPGDARRLAKCLRGLPEKGEPVFRKEVRKNKDLGSFSDSAKSGKTLEHFPTKWRPVRRKKMRQNKNLERPIRFGRIGKRSRSGRRRCARPASFRGGAGRRTGSASPRGTWRPSGARPGCPAGPVCPKCGGPTGASCRPRRPRAA